MTVRALFYTAAGALRAPWRIILFVIVTAIVSRVLFSLAAAAVGASWASGILGSSLVMAASLLAAHLVMLRWIDRRPWSSVWMGREAARRTPLAAGLVLGVLAIGAPTALLLAAGWLHLEGAPAGSWLGTAAWMTIVLAPAALWEELLFRGYLMSALRDGLGTAAALCLTSAAFGLVHLSNPGADVRSTLLVALAGVFLGGIVLATGSLYAAWLAHWAWNWTMAVLFHVAVSGNPFPTPDYRVVDAGPDWVTGGAWGPEGGAGAALGMAGTFALLMLRRRRRTERSQ